MKWVICPRCFNSSIELKSGNTVIPIQFSSDDETNNSQSQNKGKPQLNSMKEELIKLHKAKENRIFQCKACGASFKQKK